MVDVTARTQAEIEAVNAASLKSGPFKNSTNLREFINALCAQHGEFETVVDDLRNSLDVDSATGDALTKLGAWVGQDRVSANDDLQRLLTKARLVVNKSYGRAQDLIGILNAVLASFGIEIVYSDTPPAAWYITVHAVALTAAIGLDTAVYDLLESADPAGVAKTLAYPASVLSTTLFRFDSTGSTEGFDSSAVLARVL